MTIRAVLFDLFGTLVAYGDIEGGTRAGWEGILAEVHALGAPVPYEAFQPEWQRQFVTPLAADEQDGDTLFVLKILRLLRSYGLPEDRVAARRAAWACLNAWDACIELPDDAIPTLHALRGRGYVVGLVSNFDHPPYARALLARTGLAPLLDPTIISGEVGYDKPDPRIFRLALEAVGCAPEEVLFVGDSLTSDVRGAAAVGLCPVLIDMDDAHPLYDGARIRRLSELLALL